MGERRRIASFFAVLLLAAHTGLLLHCAATDFATFDEAGHLVAGVYTWETGSHHLYSVNPPLTKLLAAGPVLLARPDTRSVLMYDFPGARPELDIGDSFARDNAARFRRLLFLARLAGVGWSVLGGWLVFRWFRRLFGDAGGLLSLAVWCFEPNIIAHAHLATPDVPAAVAACAAMLTFNGYLRAPSWLAACWAGVALGVAQLCKFTLVILYPLWLLIAICSGRWGMAVVGWKTRLGQLVLVFVSSLFVLNMGYEFSGSFHRLQDYTFTSQMFTNGGGTGNRFHDTWLGAIRMPVPEDYLRGIDVQRHGFEQSQGLRYNYLRGEWRQGGWWYYYLYALAAKVPLGVWGLLLVSHIVPRPQGQARLPWLDVMCLWLPALTILALVSSQTGIQRHLRYALPAFPFAIIALGRAGAWAAAGRWWRAALVGGSLVWAVVSCLAVHPCELSYFNEIVGGPTGGPDHLLGSNADWGQDLWRLKAWLDGHTEAKPLHLAYFSHIDPRVAGIEFALPPIGPATQPPFEIEEPNTLGPRPGWYAVSVSFVHGYNASLPDGRGGYGDVPLHGYEYFRRFRPVARAGYSISIYHITPDEANAVRRDLGLPPLPAGAGTAARAR